jgi:hypothetical protein
MVFQYFYVDFVRKYVIIVYILFLNLHTISYISYYEILLIEFLLIYCMIISIIMLFSNEWYKL